MRTEEKIRHERAGRQSDSYCNDSKLYFALACHTFPGGDLWGQVMRTMIVTLSATALMLSGCVSAERSAASFNENQGVTIADVAGSIKCAFSEALRREQGKDKRLQRLNGRVAAIELTLKVIDTSAYGGSVEAKAAGPFLVTTSTGVGSITPSIGGSRTLTNTIQTVVKYRLGLEYATEDHLCEAIAKNQKIDYGFSTWLSTLIEGLDSYALYKPAGIVDSAEYDGNFQIVRKTNGGVKFDIVFVGGDVTASADNDYTQHIKMTIQPASNAVPFPHPGDPGVGPKIIIPSRGLGPAPIYIY
ncbi:hypothetical protein GA0061103_0040 [Rhizobium multihospitium]|uniref:Uncharacterized protein n=2 Tax=Rhizobium multihospitium TaxID=410764 RepID=A0A1C3X3U6_9HYPH|nr:hypothetical protein GA0061103_0040 [Rhizobium multihospitium]